MSNDSSTERRSNVGSGVRDRLKTAVPAFVVFTALGVIVDPGFWGQWWWYVGLGLTLSTVFIEPFFGSARSGIANSLAGIGAFWSASKEGLEPLWWVYFGLCAAIFLSSVLAASLPGNGAVKAQLNRFGIFGRASVLGLSALLLESATKVAQSEPRYVVLAIAAIALTVGLSLRWSYFRHSTGERQASALDVVGPGLLLLEGVDRLVPGTAILIKGRSGKPHQGVVASRIPGKYGARTVVAIDADWTKIVGELPSSLSVSHDLARQPAVGVVSAGSNTTSIAFSPFLPVGIGDCVRISDANGRELAYQIFALQLVEEVWNGSKSVETSARAEQLGHDDGGFLRSVPHLPAPHSAISKGSLSGVSLPVGYARIGQIVGTEFPIGIATDSAARGHLAVLGMSGMGKTTVVQRICSELGTVQQVVALDATGEYASRWGVPRWSRGDFSSIGFHVDEPSGALASQAESLLKGFMGQASTEYVAGTRQERTICLEEAHGFVPEWNFATKPEADSSALSARYIMQARKFGLNFIVVSQRTAVVSKSALSQCESYIAFRTVDDTSLSYLEGIVGSTARSVLPTLRRHEALCFGPAFNSERPVVVALDSP